eukprot:753682-Hanusia_phi.AAC.1
MELSQTHWAEYEGTHGSVVLEGSHGVALQSDELELRLLLNASKTADQVGLDTQQLQMWQLPQASQRRESVTLEVQLDQRVCAEMEVMEGVDHPVL